MPTELSWKVNQYLYPKSLPILPYLHLMGLQLHLRCMELHSHSEIKFLAARVQQTDQEQMMHYLCPSALDPFKILKQLWDIPPINPQIISTIEVENDYRNTKLSWISLHQPNSWPPFAFCLVQQSQQQRQ